MYVFRYHSISTFACLNQWDIKTSKAISLDVN